MQDNQGQGGTAQAIKIEGLRRTFGPVVANDDVSLTVRPGTIHAIVGENGAGKSTLMHCLFGQLQPDTGTIRLQGKTVRFASSREAQQAGIGMVHQHFMLIDEFTALDNILLGHESAFSLDASRDTARARLEDLASQYGLAVPLDARTGDLPVGLRQRLEILKALYQGTDILILDEPTAVLTPQETDQLFGILDSLRAEGRTILFISHKLAEVMRIADSVTVMRAGRTVHETPVDRTSIDDLARAMVGGTVTRQVQRNDKAPGEALLRLSQVSSHSDTGRDLHDINLEVRAGEIVGIAGVSGNGQSELLDLIAGLASPDTGEIRFRDRLLASPRQALDGRQRRELGIGFIAEDRLARGIVPGMSARLNMALGYHAEYRSGPWLDEQALGRDCEITMADFDVRPPDCGQRLAAFSGGNQQKLALGRELLHEPDLIIAGQPTRGVDIGAVARIHDALIARRNAGAGILLVSTELDELFSLTDRLLVMADGRITGSLLTRDASRETVGKLMAARTGAEAA